MKTLTLAVTVALATAAHAQTIDESTVRGVHDATVLLGGWRSVKPQPRPQPQCERFLKDQSIPNYYEACMQAVAGRPQEALRLLGITPRNDPVD